MSSRAFKKLQKQQEQKKIEQQLEQHSEEEGEEEEEEKEDIQPKQNFFAFGDDDSDDDEEDEDSDNDSEKEREEQRRKEEEEEEKKKKQQQNLSKKQKKKKNKKNNQKQQQEEEEDLDQILEELNMKDNNQNIGNNDGNQEEEEFKREEFQQQIGNILYESPLQMITGRLNYEKELQKYFKNAKFLDDTEGGGQDEFAGIKDKRVLKRLKQQQKQQSTKAKNYKLVYGLSSYRPIPDRFQCKRTKQNVYGQNEFAFYPSNAYKKLQTTYEAMKNTYDPQNIFDFTQQNPFHADAMYDVGEFLMLQGQFKQANGILQTILYIYEDSFGHEFKQIYDDVDNKFCLSFTETQYSKTLFLALLKFLNILGKKGCYKAALEYNKFLLKLNPYEDPVGAILALDYNCICSKQYEFLQYFVEVFSKNLYKQQDYSIAYLPNMIYSLALAKYLNTQDKILSEIDDLIQFTEEDFKQAQDLNQDVKDLSHNVLILQAILLYPQLFTQLATTNEFHKQQVFSRVLKDTQKKSFKDIVEHQFFLENAEYQAELFPFQKQIQEDTIQGIQKIQEVYLERSKLMYKNNQIVLWLKAAVGFLIDTMEKTNFNYKEFLEKTKEKQEKNLLPFNCGRYKTIQKSYFSDHVERLDLQNIEQEEIANQQQQQMQYMQQQQGQLNPLDQQNQGLFSQFFQSFLPWVNLPDQQNGQNQDNQQNVVYQDDDVYIEEESDNEDQKNQDEDEN